MKLKISPDLSLPLEAVARTFGILAQRGAGKSNAAVVMAEEMFRAGLHWIAIDPKGDWHGIRSSADGKKPGLSVVIFGGAKADVPLEPTGGPMLADLIVDEGLTCVLDVSEFTESEKIRFLAGVGREEGFAGRLFRRKNGEQAPTHLFLEEAHDYIPQKPFKDQAKLVHIFGKLVTMGRTRGLGATLVSQRSARIHKDVLTQIDTLLVLRTTGPQDRKAIGEWLEYHGQQKEILESLPTLKDGEAWIWSPEWLGATKRIHLRRRETYDSGATPRAGKAVRRRPATLADVDLAAIEAKMKATIERAKQEDPKELRAEIARLTRELAQERKKAPAPQTVEVEKVVEKPVPVLHDGQVKRLEAAVAELVKGRPAFVDALERLQAGIVGAAQEISTALKNGARTVQAPYPHRVRTVASPGLTSESSGGGTAGRTTRVVRPPVDGATLPKGERAVLTAVAQYPDEATRDQLTVLTGYKRSSRDAYLYRLRERGFVDQRGDRIVVTDAGMEALGTDFEPLPTGSALWEYWRGRLPTGERRILEELVAVYPNFVPRPALDEATGYRRSSRDAYLQRLSARRLVEFEGSQVRASGLLFD